MLPPKSPVEIADLNLTLVAPDLTGEAELVSQFVAQGVPLSVNGTLANPLGFVSGDQVPVSLKIGFRREHADDLR